MEGSRGLGTSFSFYGKVIRTKNNPFENGAEYGVGTMLVGHKCLMFGGYNRSRDKHWVYVYDRVKKEWLVTMPANVHNWFGSIRMTFIVDDVLYACSWYQRHKRHVFMALNLVSMEEWVPVGKGLCPITGFGTRGSYIEARNEGVLFGGESRGTGVFVYNMERSSWYSPTVSGTPPTPRRNHATCSVGLKMFILGGEKFGASDNGTLDLHVLSMEGTRFVWSTPVTTGHASRTRRLFPATCASGRIFIFGGYGANTPFIVYSIKENHWYHGGSDMTSEEEGSIYYASELVEVNANGAMLVIHDKLLVFGGNALSPNTPVEITPF